MSARRGRLDRGRSGASYARCRLRRVFFQELEGDVSDAIAISVLDLEGRIDLFVVEICAVRGAVFAQLPVIEVERYVLDGESDVWVDLRLDRPEA